MKRPTLDETPTLAQTLAAMRLGLTCECETRTYSLDDFLPDKVIREIAKTAENYLRHKWCPGDSRRG